MASVAAERRVPDFEDVDWRRVSEQGRWTLLHVAVPFACGLSEREVGERVGKSRRFVRESLQALAETSRRSPTSRLPASVPPTQAGYLVSPRSARALAEEFFGDATSPEARAAIAYVNDAG